MVLSNNCEEKGDSAIYDYKTWKPRNRRRAYVHTAKTAKHRTHALEVRPVLKTFAEEKYKCLDLKRTKTSKLRSLSAAKLSRTFPSLQEYKNTITKETIST